MSRRIIIAAFLAIIAAGARTNAAEHVVARSATPLPAKPRAWLGFDYIFHPADSKAHKAAWLFVRNVRAESPAARAGLWPQDLIVGIDGAPLRFADAAAALAFFGSVGVGRVLRLTVMHANKAVVVTIVAAAPPADFQPRWENNLQLAHPANGAAKP